ncbi:DNA recombination protein RmuC [Bifidobacterium gallicum]|uniref:30S ribosomal protein S9 n=1 Tax=Bifidobacterium gallicum DSM 20093 = LMG 11596 TaxID=561180 RepID=D1NWZ0_9BIFI|nr:DNA recombination protein RmuC [Bifidobacterium gallicum]EFA22121.1 RmuC domain protein [Bifidobacterium gallicum DSM 20093 = LMG 11596]KFI59017.1 30S ribosomal protein S9 [Bifidobacterium gallicum DSM 20093 = LMG 11596]
MFENAGVGMVVFFVVAALALVVGYLIGRATARPATPQVPLGEPGADITAQDVEALRREVAQERMQTAQVTAQCAEYRAQAEGLREQLAYVKNQLALRQQEDQARMEQERARAAQQAQQRQDEQRMQLEQQSKVLEALAPVQKNLDALQTTVAKMEEGRRQEMGALGQQLKGLSEQQTRLDHETSTLAAALRNNKTRGAWGEAQLRNIVESAGLTEHVDFDTQVVVQDADGQTLRPDMVIHLPGGKTIPIDAKVPYSDYQRACQIPDSASEAELQRRDSLLQAHAKALREHVRALSAKEYWNALPSSPDFVIAFIPNESLLQAALQADPTLLDDAFARKVALTSPVTLWAVLKSVAFAWQQQTLTDDAKMLFDLSRELYERFAVLGDHATALGNAITRTVTAYNKFASSLESRVLVSARRLQRIDQSKVIGTVDMIDPDKSHINELTAPEVTSEDPQARD